MTQEGKESNGGAVQLKCRKYLTTGNIASILGVAPRTVGKWCDNGLLKHWRIPGGSDRRVEPRDFVEFAREVGIPIPAETRHLIPAYRLLLVAPTTPMLDAFEGALQVSEDAFGGRPVDIAEDAFEAGLLLRGVHDLIILDGNIGLGLSSQIAEEAMKVPGVRVVVAIPEDAGNPVLPGCVLVRHPVRVSDLLLEVSERGAT